MVTFQPLQVIHGNARHETLSRAFNQIFGNGIPFLAPKDYANISKTFPQLAGQIDGNTRVEWGFSLIESMLKKGYNPAALTPTLVSSKLCVDSAKYISNGSRPINVIELGTGAGWSTLILYNSLRNQFDNFVMHAIDKSPYAIACTAKMFEHFEIPYQVELSDNNLRCISKKSRVILYKKDFIPAVKKFDNNSIHAVYSNHGSAYLTSSEHTKLLEAIRLSLIYNGSFVADSLAPKISVNLSKKFVISSILLGKNRKRFSEIPAEKRFLYESGSNGDRVLRIMRDKAAANFFDWLNYLFYRGHIDIFIKYISALSRSVKTQQEMKDWVKMPSEDLLNKANQSKLLGWTAKDSGYQQAPYVQTVKLIKS